MAKMNTLNDLLAGEMKDLYSAEKQILKALPKMVKAASDEGLRSALEAHLQETNEHVNRLEKAGDLLGIKLTGKRCKGMEGVIEEGAEAIGEDGQEPVLDLGLIAAASRVEHYEMAGYLTAISLAQQVGENEVATLLQQTLQEEMKAEKTLRGFVPTMMKTSEASAVRA